MKRMSTITPPAKSIPEAVYRLAEHLDFTAEKVGRGKNATMYIEGVSPSGIPVDAEGTASRCLYMLALLARSPRDVGGLGMSLEELQEVVNFTGWRGMDHAILKERSTYIGHEGTLLLNLAGYETRF